MTLDPTRTEMLEYLTSITDLDPETDEFDREEALYWFASDYHAGQWSNLYAALGASLFHPGPMASGSQSYASGHLYNELVREYSA
jgi:hypothetical protein